MAAIDEKSSTGLDVPLVAALAYFMFFVSGIALLLLERESRFVRFHAMQSTVTFIGLFVVLGVLTSFPFIGFMFAALGPPVILVLWLVLMFKAFQGERFKLPVVGDIAEQKT